VEPRLAYILGVLKGDGFTDDNSVGMNVKDKDFALEFKHALEEEFGKPGKLHRYDGLWRALLHSRKAVRSLRGMDYRAVGTGSTECVRAFLKGMFDSEGSVNLHLAKGVRIRRVELYNTDIELMAFCERLLTRLGIKCRKMDLKRRAARILRGRVLPPGKCYRLSLREKRANFARFEQFVGFSIKRKADTLRSLIKSYAEYRSKWKDLKKGVLAAKGVKSYTQIRKEFNRVPKGTIDRWLYVKDSYPHLVSVRTTSPYPRVSEEWSFISVNAKACTC
jgi:hypothetical protein